MTRGPPLRTVRLNAAPELLYASYGSDSGYGHGLYFVHDAATRALDGLTHAEQWRASVPSGLDFYSMLLADVDLDGQLEVAAATDDVHSGAPGAFVYDAATGALEWQSPPLGTFYPSLSLLRVANVDGDPQPEIVAAGFGAPRAPSLLGGAVWRVTAGRAYR
jgi:outer membrane protein assembly factor BamB